MRGKQKLTEVEIPEQEKELLRSQEIPEKKWVKAYLSYQLLEEEFRKGYNYELPTASRVIFYAGYACGSWSMGDK